MLPIAFLLTTLGTGSLYLGWRGSLPSTVTRPLGWLLICAAGLVATTNHGNEFGLIYAALLFACGAWLWVLFEAEAWQPKARPERSGGAQNRETEGGMAHGIQAWSLQGTKFLVVILLSGLTSMFVSVLATRWLPWALVDRAALIVTLTPLLWGSAMVWALHSPRAARNWLAGLLMLSAAALVLT